MPPFKPFYTLTAYLLLYGVAPNYVVPLWHWLKTLLVLYCSWRTMRLDEAKFGGPCKVIVLSSRRLKVGTRDSIGSSCVAVCNHGHESCLVVMLHL